MGVSIDRDLLLELLRCHSTPGDEGEVAAVLTREWEDAGWVVTRHGQYAVSARRPGDVSGRPRLLITAHMDSPGYVVQAEETDRLRLVNLGALGGACIYEGKTAPGILKTRSGKLPVTIHDEEIKRDESYWIARPDVPVRYGDRVCFATEPALSDEGVITSPFLDNRLGCALLCEVARALPDECAFEVVVGATASEEFGGFGAPVLARAVEPDVVIVLDATYEDTKQNVLLGKGPVLTLADESVLVSPAMRDVALDWFEAQGLPLQTEVYDFSGTDSKAFPRAGLPAPVFALLIPSRDNHSPAEVADLADYAALREALLRFAADPPAMLRPS